MEEEETEQKHQYLGCGRWFEEHEMIGEVCEDCQISVIEEEV